MTIVSAMSLNSGRLLISRKLRLQREACRIELARVVAESHFDLARIRVARTEVLARIGDLECCSSDGTSDAISALERIARYERRTRSKLRKGLSALLQSGCDAPPGGPQ